VSGQDYDPIVLPPAKNQGTYLIGRWVGPRGGLDVLEKGNTSCPYRTYIVSYWNCIWQTFIAFTPAQHILYPTGIVSDRRSLSLHLHNIYCILLELYVTDVHCIYTCTTHIVSYWNCMWQTFIVFTPAQHILYPTGIVSDKRSLSLHLHNTYCILLELYVTNVHCLYTCTTYIVSYWNCIWQTFIVFTPAEHILYPTGIVSDKRSLSLHLHNTYSLATCF
jgi:hypothetical protein